MIFAKIWDRAWAFVSLFYILPINWLILKIQCVSYKSWPQISGVLNITNRGTITVGNNVILTSSSIANPVGGTSQTSLYCSPKGKIIIMDKVAISNSVIFSQNSIEIHSGAMIGGGCQVYDSDFHSLDFEQRLKIKKEVIKTSPVVIGTNAFLGCNVTVLKGTVIGENSIIGAGSVVSGYIPENQIWGGNPAKFIKLITNK
jgi:acetyltransferase-like isoleucine patch superfamily enzyme